MKGDDLPPGDHIVRYVRPGMIQESGDVDGSDFRLRPARPDEKGLSVNWLEVLGAGKDHQLSEVRRLCSSRLSLRRNGRFAEMNVGTVLRVVSEELDTPGIVHDPLEAEQGLEADPSHSEISGLPPGESDQAMLVGDLIAACVMNLYPAV